MPLAGSLNEADESAAVAGLTEPKRLPTELAWVWRNVLSPRRRVQGALLLGLMLVGAFAELMTLGAVVPLLAVFAGSSATAPGSHIGQLMSGLGIHTDGLSLVTVGLAFCGIAVASAVVRIILAWIGQRFVFRVGYDIGVALYDRMLHQPYAFHIGVNSSRVIASLESIQKLLTSMLIPMLQACIAFVVALFIIAGLVLLSPFASLFALSGFALIYGCLSFATRHRLRRNADVIATMNRRRIQAVQEGLGGICDVLLDNTQAVHLAKFARIDSRLRNAQGANALIAIAPRFLAEATGMILIVSLAVLLYQQKGGAAAALPVLGALALGAQRLLPLIQQSYVGWANLLSSRGMFFQMTALLRRPMPQPHAGEDLPVLQSKLEMRSVGFSYVAEHQPTLSDITLSIPKGSRVGFVGKTGSGKTTLLNLLMGLLSPTAGEILVDSRRLTAANLRSWQKQVAHVPQFIFLTDGSIAENVALGVPPEEVDLERVRSACEQADIAEFIDTLPNGYSSFVGERGVRLSGGQIQRIGLARALYKHASVLILDEATSALDDATEANIIEAVQRLGREYTVLMIAHRTTTLRQCDIVFRLDCGRLVEFGPPAQVLGLKALPTEPPCVDLPAAGAKR